MIQVDEEEDFTTLHESLISFQLSGPNERLSGKDQANDESASSKDSIVLSMHKEPRRQFTHKEKGKKKMPKHDTSRDKSDRSKSDSGKDKDGNSMTKSESAKRALKLANQQLR